MSAPLLSPAQLAERLGVSVDTVYRHSRVWPCVRVGPLLRFDYDAVVAHLAAEAEREAAAS